MRPRVIHVSIGDELGDLSMRQHRNMTTVLGALKRAGRLNTFDATANKSIAKTLVDAERRKLIVVTPKAFPWSDVLITPEGEALIAEAAKVHP